MNGAIPISFRLLVGEVAAFCSLLPLSQLWLLLLSGFILSSYHCLGLSISHLQPIAVLYCGQSSSLLQNLVSESSMVTSTIRKRQRQYPWNNNRVTISVDGTCEWTNGNTRMPATYVAWTLRPSLHTYARMRPITVTLWNQFSEIEAAAMANLPGTFPVAIGMRLKMSNYHVGWQHGTHQFSEIICIV